MSLTTLACMFSFGLAALSQDDAALASKVEAVKYPALSRLARIQGDVRLHLGPKGPELISGHPLLVPAAMENLKNLDNLAGADIEVIYHFVLMDSTFRVSRRTVKKGDAFDRLILRALRIKTERVVEESECVEKNTDLPKNRIDLTKNPVEVWIYGATACLNTQASYIAMR